MGSKSHDIYSLQMINICNQNVDLYRKNLVQFSVFSKKGTNIFKGLLKNSQRPVNLTIFERLGFTTKVLMTKEILTDKAVFNFIKNRIDSSIVKLVTWCFIPYNHLNVIEQLKDRSDLSIDTTDIEIFTIHVDGNEIKIKMPSIRKDGMKYYIMKIYMGQEPSEVPAMGHDLQGINNGEYIYCSSKKNKYYNSLNPDDVTLQIPYEEDERATIYIKYTDEQGNTKEWIGFDDITREATTTEVLGIVLKDNGRIINETNKMHVALSNLGIKYKDIEDSLYKDTLKTFFITYATKNKKYHFFSRYLEGIYNRYNKVSIKIGGNTFMYYFGYKRKNNLEEPTEEYFLAISTSDGEYIRYEEGDREFFYFIPLNLVDMLTVKERYQFIKECLVAVAYSHDVVHTKWHESGFFHFALMVAATFLSGNPALAISLTVASEIIASTNISPELKQAIIIATSLAIGSVDGKLFDKSITIVDVANISAKLGEYYFKSKAEDIYSQIKEYLEKERRLIKAIQQIKNQSIFVPMEQVGSYYDLQYSLLYNYNDLYYNTINEPTINDKNLI